MRLLAEQRSREVGKTQWKIAHSWNDKRHVAKLTTTRFDDDDVVRCGW